MILFCWSSHSHFIFPRPQAPTWELPRFNHWSGFRLSALLKDTQIGAVKGAESITYSFCLSGCSQLIQEFKPLISHAWISDLWTLCLHRINLRISSLTSASNFTRFYFSFLYLSVCTLLNRWTMRLMYTIMFYWLTFKQTHFKRSIWGNSSI